MHNRQDCYQWERGANWMASTPHLNLWYAVAEPETLLTYAMATLQSEHVFAFVNDNINRTFYTKHVSKWAPRDSSLGKDNCFTETVFAAISYVFEDYRPGSFWDKQPQQKRPRRKHPKSREIPCVYLDNRECPSLKQFKQNLNFSQIAFVCRLISCET